MSVYDPRDLAEEAIEYLRTVLASRPTGRQMHVGVSAAGRLLEHVRLSLDPLEQLVALLGDEEAVLDWMRDILPKLEARARARDAITSLGEPKKLNR